MKPGDRVQGGVALRATEDDVWVHPYVFRQVCTNGAIIARATQTLHIEPSDFSAAFGGGRARRCDSRGRSRLLCARSLLTGADAMRSSVDSPIDIAVAMASMLSRLPDAIRSGVFDSILDAFGFGEPLEVRPDERRDRGGPRYTRPRGAMEARIDRRLNPVRV